MLTVDKSTRYEQSVAGRRISVVTMDIKYVDASSLGPLIPSLVLALERLQPGSFVVIRPEE